MSNRVPNKSQIGHLNLKSSAYAPTAMSYMGQDLIMNHMHSHYRRILSAKASVDTSPPKSMKMHMKVRDQKKRASSDRRDCMSPLSARSNTSNISQQHTGRLSSRSSSADNLAYPSRHARRTPRVEQKPRSSTPLDSSERPQSVQVDHRFHSSRLTDYSSPRLDEESLRNMPNEENSYGLYQQGSSKLLVADNDWGRRQPRSIRNSDPYTSLEHGKGRASIRGSKFDSTVDPCRPQKEAKHRQDHKSSLDNNYNFTLDLHQSDEEYLGDNVGNTSIRKMPSGLKNSGLYEGADPDELAFSYKGPPSSRREPNTVNIWEEEQLYLKFISDVTTDILARGVFSNRVLQHVFDSHIERRKHQLDEERMREMIDQLKEDLNVTDLPSQS